MKFIKNYSVEKLSPADYNPRKINKKHFQKLKESILNFGIVKPIIVNRTNGSLTAGHQRIKALQELGITEVPVLMLENIAKSDEIKFNLFHNSIETNLSNVNVMGIDLLDFCFNFAEANCINFDKNLNPAIVKEIGKLIIKYGELGNVVCDETGKIICNSDYAITCKLLNKPLLIYKMENKKVVEFLKYISLDYGQYYFDTLGIKDYNQTYCQMNKFTGEKALKSTTYEKFVIPILQKQHRLFDFGSGKCTFAKMLRDNGYKVFMYEPFFRKERENAFDISQIINFINEIENEIEQNGLFDIVVLDSVLNSITNKKMQHNVLLACNSLLNENGTLILGARCLGKAKWVYNQKKSTSTKREIEFLDKDNFSVTYRNGVWTKQRFNTKENLKNELSPYFEDIEVLGSETRSNIHSICKKPIRWSISDYEKTLNTEFNMTYPNDFKHNKHQKLVKTVLGNLLQYF